MDTSFEKTKGNDTWLTPQYIFESLECKFDLDPCHIEKPPFKTANKWYTKNIDGLIQPWNGLVWCNPPYGKETEKWVKKCIEHNNCIMLIFNRMDTGYWHENIFKHASGIKIIRGRIKFLNAEGVPAKNSPGVGSVLVSFGHEAKEILRKCTLNGKYIELRKE